MPTQDKLQRAVLHGYPHPIANVYTVLINERNPQARSVVLPKLFEVLVHYLAAVALSAYVRSDLPDADRDARLPHGPRGRWVSDCDRPPQTTNHTNKTNKDRREQPRHGSRGSWN